MARELGFNPFLELAMKDNNLKVVATEAAKMSYYCETSLAEEPERCLQVMYKTT